MPKGTRSKAIILAQCIMAILVCCQPVHAAKFRVGRPGRHNSKLQSRMPPQCGRGWQLWYANLHAEMLRRPSPEQRLAVVQVTYNGLGDRLASIVSVFWFAALTGRAFRIQWWEYEESLHPQLEVAVSSPHIDWKSVPSDRELGKTHIEDHPQSPRAHHPFGYADLATIGNESRTVWWKANTGSLDELFYNPHHRQQLFEWGLRPETAAGCALAYLFLSHGPRHWSW
ncbi:hypothetical protein COCOBI_09-0100 [Coccomyxa sp. Obi]|nr:hypothetical protein COCOBI_09-0100 [Coccomyxa sp. Obi]